MNYSKFAVIGVGRYGATIARRLAEKGAQVFAFDPDEEKIEDIKDEVAFAVTLDATDIRALKAQALSEVDAAVVAIGENFEATVLTCVHLIDMGVKRIIARASGDHQRLILEKIGISEILTPEDLERYDVYCEWFDDDADNIQIWLRDRTDDSRTGPLDLGMFRTLN